MCSWCLEECCCQSHEDRCQDENFYSKRSFRPNEHYSTVFPLCHTSEHSHTCREPWVMRPVIELCHKSLKNSSVREHIWSAANYKSRVFLRFSSHLVEWGRRRWRSGRSLGLFVVFLRCSWFVIMDGLNHRSPVPAWRVPALGCGGAFHPIQYLGGW